KQKTIGRSYRALIIIGFVAIAVSFLAYAKNDSTIVTPAAMPALQRLAVATYVVLVAAFVAIGWGLHKFYRSKRILLVSAIGYGVFFAITSGIIIYKPDINATDYVFPKPPHVELSPCCDLPGYMPMIFAFFTEHVGLQIIPLNLVLLVVVSFLVG